MPFNKALIKRALKERTNREVLINTLGNYANIAFSALYIVIIARFFTPAENGIYIVLFTLVYVFTNIFDFGTSATIYSYLPNLIHDKLQSFSFLKITFLYQSCLACIGLIILGLFINPINTTWLNLHVPIHYYIIAFGTIPLLIWQNFILNTLYASRRFLTANALINSTNILRLILLFVLKYTGILNLQRLLILFGPIGPLFFFLCVLLIHPSFPKQLLEAPIDRQHLNLKYSFTFFIATQLYFIASRLDLFLIAHFLSKTETGYYGLAQKIVFSILTTINSVTQVLSPQFASSTTATQINILMRRFFLYCTIPIALLIGAILTPDAIYTFVFSKAYTAMPILARLLAGVNIFFVIMQIPMLFFLYTIKKPKYILISNCILLVISGVGSYFFVQVFGSKGPPLALLCSYIAVSIYAYYFFRKELKILKKK